MIYFIPMILLVIMGWLIKYKKVTWLISGYNTASAEKKETYDVDKLCYYMGNFLFVLASIFMGMALLSTTMYAYADQIAIVGFIVLTIAVIGGIIYLNTNNRVKK